MVCATMRGRAIPRLLNALPISVALAELSADPRARPNPIAGPLLIIVMQRVLPVLPIRLRLAEKSELTSMPERLINHVRADMRERIGLISIIAPRLLRDV